MFVCGLIWSQKCPDIYAFFHLSNRSVIRNIFFLVSKFSMSLVQLPCLAPQSLHPRVPLHVPATRTIVSFLDGESIVCLSHTCRDICRAHAVVHGAVGIADKLTACAESLVKFGRRHVSRPVYQETILRFMERRALNRLVRFLESTPHHYQRVEVDVECICELWEQGNERLLGCLQARHLLTPRNFTRPLYLDDNLEKIIYAAFSSQKISVILRCIHCYLCKYPRTEPALYDCVLECAMKCPLMDEDLVMYMEAWTHHYRDSRSDKLDAYVPFFDALLNRRWFRLAREILEHEHNLCVRAEYFAFMIVHEFDLLMYPEFAHEKELADHLISLTRFMRPTTLSCTIRPLIRFMRRLVPSAAKRGEEFALKIADCLYVDHVPDELFELARHLSFDSLLEWLDGSC